MNPQNTLLESATVRNRAGWVSCYMVNELIPTDSSLKYVDFSSNFENWVKVEKLLITLCTFVIVASGCAVIQWKESETI